MRPADDTRYGCLGSLLVLIAVSAVLWWLIVKGIVSMANGIM